MYKLRIKQAGKFEDHEHTQDEETGCEIPPPEKSPTPTEPEGRTLGSSSLDGQHNGDHEYRNNTSHEFADGGNRELLKLQNRNRTLEDHVDWMQSQIDHSHWIQKFFVEDIKIEQDFDLLMEKIRAWSTHSDFKADTGEGRKLQFPTNRNQRHLLCQVSPWCETKDRFETNVGEDPRHRAFLLRGLVARVLCDRVFAPRGEDYWLDKESRSQLHGIEQKVKPTGQFDQALGVSRDTYRLLSPGRLQLSALFTHDRF